MLMTREVLVKQLDKAERNARLSKAGRFVSNPFLYPALLFFNKIIYPVTRKGITFHPVTFFGLRMKTLLPSGTDLALHGMKGHDSEIRLTRFLVNTLQPGDTFIDVGAHYGYYTMLASVLTGSNGHLHGIEASGATSRILRENATGKPNVILHHAAASHSPGEITFYEYPGPYAEWNTTVQHAYSQQPWIKRIAQQENRVPAIRLDDLMDAHQIDRAFIKIDIEGGEYDALRGLATSLLRSAHTIMMEYHHLPGNQSSHNEAMRLLGQSGYQAYSIDRQGKLQPLADIDRYMETHGFTTDNLVFRKSKPQ